MDSIRITITRGVADDGTGGQVVDNAVAVLGSLPDGTPVLDVIIAAFAATFGTHTVDGEPVTPYRNVAYHMRMHMTEIVAAYASKQAAAQAQVAAQQSVSAALGSVTILGDE
jgi:hypothetical protein